MDEQLEEMTVGGKFLISMGTVLVIAAVAVLVMIAFLTYQIFYQPDQVYLIKYLMETIDASDKAFFGRVDNSDFFVHISDPIKYFLYFMAIFLVLSIVVKIFSSILSAGVGLIKMANASCRSNN